MSLPPLAITMQPTHNMAWEQVSTLVAVELAAASLQLEEGQLRLPCSDTRLEVAAIE